DHRFGEKPMSPRRRTPPLLLLAAAVLAAAAALVVSSAHAAPVPEGQLPKKMHREQRAKQVLLPFATDQPMHFPRQLLPLLLGEMDADLQEPGDAETSAPLLRGRAAQRPDPLEVGPNHLLNNPIGDPPATTQSENGLAAFGRFLVAGWN